MLLPAVTGSGESVLLTLRLALAWTVSVSLAVAGTVFVGGVELETDTLLVCGPGGVVAGTVKLTLTVAVPPAAMVPRVQLKFGPPARLLQPPGSVPRVKPVGQ